MCLKITQCEISYYTYFFLLNSFFTDIIAACLTLSAEFKLMLYDRKFNIINNTRVYLHYNKKKKILKITGNIWSDYDKMFAERFQPQCYNPHVQYAH